MAEDHIEQLIGVLKDGFIEMRQDDVEHEKLVSKRLKGMQQAQRKREEEKTRRHEKTVHLLMVGVSVLGLVMMVVIYAFYKDMNSMAENMEAMKGQMGSMDKSMQGMAVNMNSMDGNMSYMRSDMHSMNITMGGMGGNIANMDRNMAGMAQDMGTMSGSVVHMTDKVSKMSTDVHWMGANVAVMTGHISSMDQGMTPALGMMQQPIGRFRDMMP
jgi:hypothetical protein